MKKYYTLCTIIFTTIFVSQTKAQTYSDHNLGFGIENALRWQDEIDKPHYGIGAKVDYQRNFTSWFSLRVSINFIYFTPLKTETQRDFTNADLNIHNTYRHTNISNSIAPVFYYRTRAMNLFAGSRIGFGYNYYNHIYEMKGVQTNGSEKIYIRDFKPDSDSYVMQGFAPFAGISFNTGKYQFRRNIHEWELCFIRVVWNQLMTNFELSRNVKYYGVQLTYRYNL